MSSLRRTALARKAELRRGGPLRRTAKRPRAPKTVARPATASDTGPTAAQRRTVAERAGYRCELCGQTLGWLDGPLDGRGITWFAPHSFHHRRPRGMGGTRRADSNEPQNLLLLCGTGTTGCHGRVEANRSASLGLGWLLRQDQDPAGVPVNVWHCDGHTTPRLLTRDGQYVEVAS